MLSFFSTFLAFTAHDAYQASAYVNAILFLYLLCLYPTLVICAVVVVIGLHPPS
jgi:hypothetical protein